MLRTHLFVDYWNFQSALNDQLPGIRIDWFGLGQATIKQAREFTPEWIPLSYTHTSIFASRPPADASLSPSQLRNVEWLERVLGTHEGFTVSNVYRVKKLPSIHCSQCHANFTICPVCAQTLTASTEKGVEQAITVAILEAVMDRTLDAVILAGQDRDYIPLVEALKRRKVPIINLGFQHGGHTLAEACDALVTVQELLIPHNLRRILP